MTDLEQLQARVKELEEAIRIWLETDDYRKGRKPRRKGALSKYDACVHGEPYYNDCSQCTEVHFTAALKGSTND